VALRARAVRLGLKLSEYGLYRALDDARVAGETEAGVYQALGLAWIPPELRENHGEIEAAAEGRLPELVELEDIRGDLHMHTTETDGRATLEEMADAASAMGYAYIAITDHSKALAMANGLDEKRVVEFARRVRQINRGGAGIHIFSGVECDILKNGAMDLADAALAELDLVIGSVHSHMNMESAEMTERLLRALECPRLRILGHPTGRLLLQRDPFPFDFDKLVEEAVRRGFVHLTPPVSRALREELVGRFPDLRGAEVDVVKTSGRRDTVKVAAVAAERAFDAVVRIARTKGGEPVGIGLGPGRATLEFCRILSDRLEAHHEQLTLRLVAITAGCPVRLLENAPISFLNLFPERLVESKLGLFAETLVPAGQFKRLRSHFDI